VPVSPSRTTSATPPTEVATTGRPAAPAGAILVTTCNDGGPGSLRDAYFNAVDGDTIDLTQLACSTTSKR
jgi:hypothetical protein